MSETSATPAQPTILASFRDKEAVEAVLSYLEGEAIPRAQISVRHADPTPAPAPAAPSNVAPTIPTPKRPQSQPAPAPAPAAPAKAPAANGGFDPYGELETDPATN